MKKLLLILTCFFLGCQAVTNPAQVQAPQKSYSGGGKPKPFGSHGFAFNAPDTWRMYVEELRLDGPDQYLGTEVSIRNYEWSPIIQLDRLPENMRWEEDLPRVDALLIKSKAITELQSSETITRYNKFTGHGVRKIGIGDGRRSEYVLFYPEGEMAGVRVLVIIYASPAEIALREMDNIIASVSFDPKVKNR